VAIAAACVAPSAEASFPGSNGSIVFSRGGDLFTMGPDGSGQASLFSPGAAGSEPALSADGSKIAYTESSPFNDVVVRNTDGSGTPVHFQPGPGPFTTLSSPALSADGSTLVYTRMDFVDGAPPSFVYNLVIAGSTNPASATFLTSSGTAGEPALSPGGGTIAFTDGFGTANWDIRIMPTAGGPSAPLAGASTSDNESNPQFTPDGGRIVYQRKVGSSWDVYAVDLASPGVSIPLVASAAQELEPAPSPDGTKLAFGEDTSGSDEFSDEIFVAAANGNNPVNITNSGSADGDSHPAWGALASIAASHSVTETIGNAKCRKGYKLKNGRCKRKKRRHP
jgi:Tol biopolymer transport system component